MSYFDIVHWREMAPEELYQELIAIYGEDIPPLQDISCIYVNNCYELSAEIEYLPTDYFVMLWKRA